MKSLSTHIVDGVIYYVQDQAYKQTSLDVICRSEYNEWEINKIINPIFGQLREGLAERLSNV